MTASRSLAISHGLTSRIKRINRLFLATVIAPTLLSAIYFGLIASDVYTSEARFIVRVPDRQSASPLGVLLKGAGFSRSQDDSYTVQDFILSRDALMALDKKLHLGKVFTHSNIDIFSRFAGLDWDNSFEALYRYYLGKVSVQLDSISSITTLTIRAFSAEDAQRINQELLDMSEALVNQLNERGRRDMIRFASKEVEDAENKAAAAALELSNYRNLKGVIDPGQQSTLQLQQVAKLQEELIATKAQLSQLTAFTKDNPQIPAVKKRMVTLQGEIEREMEKVVGGQRSLADKASEYQRLVLKQEFADKQLASAMASLEQARNEIVRKQLYLERIVQPSLPDVAMDPRRIRRILETFFLSLIVYGVALVLLAGVREHRD